MSGTVLRAVAAGGGIEGKGSTYFIVGEDGSEYVCDYTDIVTDGFRTLRPNNPVRFVPADDGFEARATHVLKLNEPTVDEFYQEGHEPASARQDGD